MAYLVPRFGCFGASCSDLWPDNSPTLPPAFYPGQPGGSTSVGVNVSMPGQSALLAPPPMPERQFLPWWLWFGIGILVALAVKE